MKDFNSWLKTEVANFGLENIPNSPPIESAGTLELNYWSDVCINEEEQNKKM